MSYLVPRTSSESRQSTERIGQGDICGESQWRSPRTVTIHILDDDSLLNIFYLYRPAVFEGGERSVHQLGGKEWNREQWWYQLAHVCQRWRNLILGSASYLELCLVCTTGTPVADMLAHSPPFPLVFDYSINPRHMSKREQEEIIFALKQHGRVRRVRLQVYEAWYLCLLIEAIDEEYPVLEYLIVDLDNEVDTSMPVLALTETLQAPHLRHLLLKGLSLPIGSRLLTSAVGLVTLALITNNPVSYFEPNSLLQCLSFVPQLENLLIAFSYPLPNGDVETQLADTPIVTRIMLHNLRWFEFEGASAYMEAVARQVTAPHLERIQVRFYEEPSFSVPNLLQIINTTENLRFDCAVFDFTKDLSVQVNLRAYDLYEYIPYLPGEAEMHFIPSKLSMVVECRPLDKQVSSVVQIFNSPSQIFSMVEHLVFQHMGGFLDETDVTDRTEWRKLLRSFSNAKTLWVNDGLVKGFSRCLRSEDGEHPLELLPELQELLYCGTRDTADELTPFIDARRDAGRPVTLVFLS